MKLHLPHPHAPAMLHHRKENPADEHHHKEHHFRQDVSHAVTETLDAIEHGVDAIDPLHVFSPNEIPTRLVLPKQLFKYEGDAKPILCARSNNTFHNLQVQPKTAKSNTLVIEDATTLKPLIMIERTPEPRKYDIFTTTPTFDGQEPCDKQGDLYHTATVIRNDEKSLDVIMEEGGTDPTFVIQKAGLAASFATKHWINRTPHVHHDPPVASTHPWQGSDMMVEVLPGENVLFMFCLAVIANEMIQ